ncbi:MAG: hypothetical protein ABIZ49_03340 [Opitutaceae bacterium]
MKFSPPKYIILLGALLFLSGCISNNVARSALPAAWQTALEKPATSAAAFSGIYKNYGDNTHTVPGENSVRNSLAAFTFQPLDGFRPPPPGSTTELIVKGTGKMDVILRDGTNVVTQAECTFTWDAADQALVIQNSLKPVAKNSDHVSGAGIGWKTVRLMKGADGALYVQSKVGGVGAAYFLIPFGGTEESWGRWETAPVAPSRYGVDQ